MKYSEEISNKLNTLLERNIEAVKGYNTAIDRVSDNDNLKMFFKRRVSEREEFTKELRTEILQYGQVPEDSGSFKAALHRNWMNLKAIFSSNEEEKVLEASIEAEEKSIEDYNDVLKEDHLPPTIENMLLKHKKAIQAAINNEKVKLELV